MKFKKLLLSTCLTFSFTLPALAAPSINDMQGCQGLLDFVDGKLSSAPSKYPVSDVKAIRLGLKQYNNYIQKEIVSPGLIKFNGGDLSKANAMQKQVDAYKLTLVNAYNTRYHQNRLFIDHAVAVNNCAKKAVPSGLALENLKFALQTMIKLAKMN